MNRNNKKILAEKIRNKLNSLEYISMPDSIITHDDRHADMLTWLWGAGLDGNIHKKENWITGHNINPGKGNKHESEHMVDYDELEKDDWEEIVNLIQKRNKEKEELWETKLKNIKQKLNQQPDKLYYYWGKVRKNERADCWCSNKGMRGFATFLGGNGNGLTHHLYIAEEHSVLDSFSFQTGFYLVDNNKTFQKAVGHYEGGFESSSGETNPHNWKKYIEASDQVSITPVQVAIKPIEKPTKNKKPGENKQIAGGENNSLNSSAGKLSNKIEDKTVEWLIQYFQANGIKEITAESNGNLKVTHNNNNKIVSTNHNSELQNVENYLAKSNDKTLKLEELKKLLDDSNQSQNSTPNSPKTDYVPWIIGGSLIFALLGAVIIALKIQSKKHKIK